MKTLVFSLPFSKLTGLSDCDGVTVTVTETPPKKNCVSFPLRSAIRPVGEYCGLRRYWAAALAKPCAAPAKPRAAPAMPRAAPAKLRAATHTPLDKIPGGGAPVIPPG